MKTPMFAHRLERCGTQAGAIGIAAGDAAQEASAPLRKPAPGVAPSTTA